MHIFDVRWRVHLTWDALHNKFSFPSYDPPNDRHGSPLQSFVVADDGDSMRWRYQDNLPGNRVGDTSNTTTREGGSRKEQAGAQDGR